MISLVLRTDLIPAWKASAPFCLAGAAGVTVWGAIVFTSSLQLARCWGGLLSEGESGFFFCSNYSSSQCSHPRASCNVPFTCAWGRWRRRKGHESVTGGACSKGRATDSCSPAAKIWLWAPHLSPAVSINPLFPSLPGCFHRQRHLPARTASPRLAGTFCFSGSSGTDEVVSQEHFTPGMTASPWAVPSCPRAPVALPRSLLTYKD